MTEKDIKKRIRQLKKLVQYRDKPEEELRKIILAKEKEEQNQSKNEEQWNYIKEGLFLSKSEEKTAKQLFDRYMESLHVKSFQQLNELKDLIFIEMEKNKAREVLKSKQEKNEDIVFNKIIESVGELIDKSREIADRIFGNKNDSDKSNLLKLYKKFKLWMEENQGIREFPCPHCSEFIRLKIRTDRYEAEKHPFFKDRRLTNPEMMKDYLKGVLSKEQVARYMHVSTMYMDWILDKHFNKNNPLYQKYLERRNAEEKSQEKPQTEV